MGELALKDKIAVHVYLLPVTKRILEANKKANNITFRLQFQEAIKDYVEKLLHDKKVRKILGGSKKNDREDT